MLSIYNTLTRSEEEFKPLEDGKVRMYVCGPTVYSNCHLGHARPAVVFDTIRRYLIHLGYDVTFASNITDIDDKIIARANEEGVDISEIAATYTADYDTAMDGLGVMPPDIKPLCTEHIPQMIDLVQKIIDNGHGYVADDGSVYFDVMSLDGYGKLSRRDPDEEGVSRVDPDEHKRHPSDFVLWKASKPGEPKWESPWGDGRPGWHIECSAMSNEHLGVPFDIHGGGEDLIFPHHENEIAQCEAGYGSEFARYWVHNAFVTMDAEKMSKSLGNVLNLVDLLERFPGAELRFFILGTHYRTAIDFAPERLDEAKAGLERIFNALEVAERYIADKDLSAVPSTAAEDARAKFLQSMDADFNTAGARAAIFELVNEILRVIRAEDPKAAGTVQAMVDTVRELMSVLGLPAERPASAGGDDAITDDEIEALIKARADARAAKDFAESDRIRDELAAGGIEIRDVAGGKVEWKRS